jgi:RimJ/RimL family protein N-acetyltransferase
VPEPAPNLRTDRLLLRHWRAEDSSPFAAMSADPQVAQMLEGPLDRAQSDALFKRWEQQLARAPFGCWAVELIGQAPFVGMVGLGALGPEMPFGPAVEIGWRLDPAYWGRGIATEAAAVAMSYGFERCALDEIVAITAEINLRSQAVMTRLGMVRDRAGDFNHPRVAPDSPLLRHVLYRASSVKALVFEVDLASP